MLDFKHFRLQSRISTNAVRATIIPLMVVLLFAVLATTSVSYKMSINQLENKVLHLGTENRLHIQELLLKGDTEGVEAKLQSIVDLHYIQRVIAIDATGKRYEIGEPIAVADQVMRVFTMTHLDAQKNVFQLGTLVIEASRRAVWMMVFQRALVFLLTMTFSTLCILLIIVRQLNISVMAPLVRISDRLRSTQHDWGDLRLDDSRRQKLGQKDELDDLIDSIHQMRDQMLEVKESTRLGEQRLAQAAQLAGLAYCTLDEKAERFTECDERYATLHHRTVAEMLETNIQTDIIGKSLDKDQIQHASETRERLMKGSREIQTYRVNFDNGEFIYLRQYFVARHDSQGELCAIHVVAQDVTDDVLTQEVLLQSQKTEAIGQLTGGIAHDFNNILAVITGNLELSIKNSDSANVKANNVSALEAVNRGASLTRQLLSFARKQPMSPVVVDVTKLINASAALLRTSVGESITLRIASGANIWNVKTDPGQLDAALLNLTVNARDAMPQGGVLMVKVSNEYLSEAYERAHAEVRAGEYVCIAVIDNGHGMSADVIRRAIEPFFTTKAEGHGSGLGLSMAYGFARQSGGHIKINSELGHGTTIKLYLPREQIEVASLKPVVAFSKEVALNGKNILLIEDNEELHSVLIKQIESLGACVFSAHDAESALTLRQSVAQVDYILSDIVLPGEGDGWQLAKQLSSFYPNAKIIYMSGFTENSVIREGQLKTGVMFLQKPFRLQDLVQCLSESSVSVSNSTQMAVLEESD